MGKIVHLRPSKRGFDDVAVAAFRAQMINAFLNRSVRTFVTLATVSVSFNTAIEAQEFHKLLLSRRGRMK
jgi:hypothetical protein